MTQHLVEPGCTPSRAALMTGRYCVRSGLGTIILGGSPGTLKAEEFTMAELFRSQGYATATTGKWRPGTDERSGAIRQGFDECYVGVLETSDSRLHREQMERLELPEPEIAAIPSRGRSASRA